MQENRRAYRELFYTADIGGSISGAILFQETLYQAADDGTSFVHCLGRQGVLPGIKVDEVGDRPSGWLSSTQEGCAVPGRKFLPWVAQQTQQCASSCKVPDPLACLAAAGTRADCVQCGRRDHHAGARHAGKELQGVSQVCYCCDSRLYCWEFWRAVIKGCRLEG